MVNKLCATSHFPVNTGGIKCAEATRILFDLGVKLELHVVHFVGEYSWSTFERVTLDEGRKFERATVWDQSRGVW